jgi:RNA polymerase sigma-70 factor, ECF subfamily
VEHETDWPASWQGPWHVTGSDHPLKAIRRGIGRQNPASHAASSDAALVEAIAAGDQRVAFGLYHRLLPVVERTLFRVLGRRESDHEDLVQSSFEQIILTLSEHRFAGACSLNTWASTLTAHVAFRSLRSRSRGRRVFDVNIDVLEKSELMRSGDDVERNVALCEELDRLRQYLSLLPCRQGEAVLLHDVLGHSIAEIATTTGVSMAAAQSRVVRGRRELTKMMTLSAEDQRGDL